MSCRKSIVLFSFFVLMIAPNWTLAQDDNLFHHSGVKAFPSPTAFSFAKIEEIPVDLYNGTSSIPIPIYTFDRGNISLPVTLNYQSTGLKVQERASWVGLGWNLQAGGVITRVIRGIADDKDNKAYIHTASSLKASLPQPNTHAGKVILDQIAEGDYDAEPDEFYISTPTVSGKMIFMDGHFRLQFKQKVKIEPIKSGYTITSWEVTDEQGIVYTFGKTEQTTTITNSSYSGNEAGSSSHSAYTAWYLEKIDHPQTTDDIILEYTTGSYLSSQTTFSHGRIIYENSGVPCNAVPDGELETMTDVSNFVTYLTKIKSSENPNTYIQFNHASRSDLPNERRLSNIKVYENGALLKEVRFTHGYFAGTSSRLRLDSIREYDHTGTAALPAYEFDYDPSSLPAYNSYAVDYWGYYNGQTSNTHFVPTTSYFGTLIYTGANQNPSPTTDGMLTKITYPTGGSAQFTYEGNDYSFVGGSAQSGQIAAGGMRVKKIVLHDGVSSVNDIVKNYTYDMDDGSGRSSGSISGEPTYVKTGSSIIPDPDTNGYYTCNYHEILPSAFYQLGDVRGGHLGYQKVTETISSQSENGKVVHHFEKIPYAYSGNLVKKEVFNNTGGLVESRSQDYEYKIGFLTYPSLFYSWAKGMELERKIEPGLNGSEDTTYVQRSYTINDQWKHLKSDTLKVFNGGATPVEVINEYTYADSSYGSNRFMQLISKAETNSGGQVRTTHYAYAHQQYPGMATANMFAQPYSVEVKNGSTTLAKNWTQWTNSSSISPGSTWRLHKTWQWKSGSTTSAPSTSNAVLLSEVKTYDAYGNPTETEDANGGATKYYYGSNASPFTNASTAANAVNNTRGVYLTGIQKKIGSFDSSPCASDDLCYSVKYDTYGNATELTDPEDNKKTFEYDSHQRLERIKNNAGQTLNEFNYTFTGTGFSPTNPNWVETDSYTGSSTRTSREYTDGLGRAIQTVTKKGSNVIVSASNFDSLGRPWESYRPFSKTGSSLGYVNDYASRANTAYGSYAYAENEYEKTPLSRLKEAIPMGGKSTYGSVVQAYGVETVGSEKLSFTETTDPDGKKVKTYTDGWGRTRRVVADPAGINAITENIYNELGQLTETRHPNYFSPPGGSSASDWKTTYAYDKQGNMISKTGTDFGTVKYAYNKAGLLRYSQTQQQANDNEVAFSTYDELGRIKTTGIAPYTGSFTALDGNSSQAFESTSANINGANAYDAKPGTSVFPWNQVSSSLITGFTANNTKGKMVAGIYRVGTNSPAGTTNPWQLELYSYDEEGRVVTKEVHMGAKTAWKGTITYTYNRQGEVTRRKVTFNSKTLYHHYEYNDLGQLTEVTLTMDGTADTEPAEVTYEYHADGQLKKRTFRGGTAMDYTYDIQGRLTRINNPASASYPFSAKYTYFDNGNIQESEFYNPLQAVASGHNRYKYVHTYDNLNRLKSASYQNYNGSWIASNKFKVNNLGYDKQGNIESLTRYDENGSYIDYLEYFYNAGTNKLSEIDEFAGTTGSIDWDAEYTGSFGYDANGNMTSQAGKFTSITYNEFNLPSTVNTGSQTLDALYNSSGNRILKEYSSGTWTYYLRDGSETLATINNAGDVEFNILGLGVEGVAEVSNPSGVFNTSGTITFESENNNTSGSADGRIKAGKTSGVLDWQNYDWYYFDITNAGTVNYTLTSHAYYQPSNTSTSYQIEFKNSGLTTVKSSSGMRPLSSSFSVTPGRYYVRVYSYAYTSGEGYGIQLSGTPLATIASKFYLKDHLGSIRAIVDDAGNHEESFDYYPFGLEMPDRSSTSDYAYKYTGHERDKETGINIDYMLARGYDPTLARFLQVDPLYDNYPEMSPYAYVGNNPLNAIDPDGRTIYYVNGKAVFDDGEDNALNVYTTQDILDSFTDDDGVVDWDGVRNDKNSFTLITDRKKYRRWANTIADNIYDAFNGEVKVSTDSKGNITYQTSSDIIFGWWRDAAIGIAGGYILGKGISMFVKTGSGGFKLVFGRNKNQSYHAFRHLHETGADGVKVADAIAKDLKARYNSLPINQGKRFTVTVNGKTYKYSAFKNAKGEVNVGTIFDK